MDIFSSFGVDLHVFIIQSLIYFVPAIWATIRITRNRSGAAVLLWLLFVWLIPVVGPVVALIIIRNTQKRNA
jgi:hypothetical protein